MKSSEFRVRSSGVRVAAVALPVMALVIAAGCIGRQPANPAATQPVTVVDLATTQPAYYLNMPAVAHTDSLYFQPLWDACEKVARDYGYQLDRLDFRLGLLTTKPMVSKQLLEPWRKDSGTAGDVLDNSMATIRRTIRFEINNDGGTYRMTPKILVERQSVVERRTTSTEQYRTLFAGPAVSETKLAVTSEDLELPKTYWTPIGRDTEMERQVARAVEKRLK
jgi:hypothetical protein